ncbi:amino acid permease [Intrasporangium chromatireducens Q5-1]|uniref:Amino acid permease n=1 Tax=Intrasporangium chromatireducens Q5-1 TaxID=584657 RepID=W9GQ98_9MICO|nr:amino acid permease [Intrasporangium chromatireducens]EWT07237.1 amino acid permease [Intrasporangium chromatireducens Q5-1]
MTLLRTKSIEQTLAASEEEGHRLKRRLSALDLTVFGVGVIIGAGIFTVTGKAAQQYAGPSIALSFVIGAIVCGLAALCYAEFASTVPISGSAYTFSYATLGELIAWIIGWDLLLEMMLGASVVAQSWSEYLVTLLGQLGVTWPASLGPGSHFDLLAFLLIAALTVLVAIGIKESLRVNLVLVGVKVFIVLFVIVAGLFYVKRENWSPFIPPSQPGKAASGLSTPLIQLATGMTPATFGVLGIMAGAAIVFFAYIGFDVVATTAEEAKNPKRDLPIGIIGSLIICTILYMAVSLVITGMVHYPDIDPKAALASAFIDVGRPGFATLVSAGAVAGLTTVVMTLMIGATRVTFAMSRDRLLPPSLGQTHPRTGTPVRLTIIIGTLIALIASLTPIGKLEEMVNIGTLSAFMLVSLAIPVLRKRRPDLKRSFRVPGNPVVPWLSALFCFYLILNLSIETWLRFVIWMVLGFAIYFLYSRSHSRLETGDEAGALEAGMPQMLDES